MEAKVAAAKRNLGGIKRIIGVYSGKGGVGKTTVAVNLATLLAQQGFRVCLLDADIDCPNVNHALGIEQKLDLDALDKRIIPAERHGLKVVSMGSVQESPEEATVWRGPMVTDMLLKFTGATAWGDADYLIIDLPPGTSDIPLTVMKFLQPHGILVVTTPRSIAAVDAKKSANLAAMTSIPVLGVVENMSGGPFGEGKGNEIAHSIPTLFLGKIPFHEKYMHSVDEGVPSTLSSNESEQEFTSIVGRLHQAEEHHLGAALKKPKLAGVRNLALDFKAEMLDRYKNIKQKENN